PALKRLTDAEVDPPAARLRAAVDQQSRNRIELVAEVEADRTDRCLIAKPRAHRVAQVAEVETTGIGPDVARVYEEHAAEAALEVEADFLGPGEHAVAADRHAVAERAHFVAAPPPNARRAAEEKLLRERDVHLVETDGSKVAELH